MDRFAIGLHAAVCGAFLTATAAGGVAAPVPKDAGKADPVPDLKAFFTTVGKAVEKEKWPAEADEKQLRDTARVIFERAVKAAGQKDRKWPVDFEKLTKPDVTKECKNVSLENNFLIAGSVRMKTAKNSVIFASGHVQITSATNCVIIASTVFCTGLRDCVVVADDYILSAGVDFPKGDVGSVLIAGRLIQVTSATGAICHVIRPAFGQPGPFDKFPNQSSPPIRMTTADSVIFLNDADHWQSTSKENCTTVELKTPIAK